MRKTTSVKSDAQQVSDHARKYILKALPEWVRNETVEGNFTHSVKESSNDVFYSLELVHRASGKKFVTTTSLSKLSSKSDSSRVRAGLRLGRNMTEKIDRFRHGSGKRYFEKAEVCYKDKHNDALRVLPLAPSRYLQADTPPTILTKAKTVKSKPAKPKPEKVCKVCGPEDPAFPPWPICEHLA